MTLAESGHDVTILARELPADTTSAVAAAIWYPYRAYPQERVLGWATTSLDRFYELAAEEGTGVSVGSALELHPAPMPDPWWRGAARQFRRADVADLIEGYVDGWRLETVVVEPAAYLQYLRQRFEAEGGTIRVRTIESLQAVTGVGLVINCSGVFARQLCDDAEVEPIRGQVVRVQNPGLDEAVLIEEGPLALAYIVPRSRDVVIGGTAEEGEWALEVDHDVIDRLLEKAAVIEPRLADAAVLSTAVGLRPGRRSVRLEPEDVPGGRVIHNYGHGGSGFSLSWGCAEEVASLVG